MGESRSQELLQQVSGHPWRTFPVHPMVPLDAAAQLGVEGAEHFQQEDLLSDQDLLYLASAARQALADSGLSTDPSGNTTMAMVLGHENPGLGRLVNELWDSFFRTPRASDEVVDAAEDLFRRHRVAFFHLQGFSYLFHIARILAINGHNLIVNNACATGLYALEHAHQLIQTQRADAVLVATADHATQLTKCLWFADHGMYSPSGALRPFDRRRDGVVLGDAGAAVVVEELEHARRRGARVYAEYVGGAFGQETWRMTLPDVTSHTYERVVRSALEATETQPPGVDLIVAHGTGSTLADRYEAASLEGAFSGQVPQVTALKGYVGHTLGCCALLETVFSLLVLRDGVVPAAKNFEEPDPAIGLPLVKESLPRQVRTILRTVNAFGGFDAAVVLRSPPGG